MSGSVHIHWFRQDLRLSDNPSLSALADFVDLDGVFLIKNDPDLTQFI